MWLGEDWTHQDLFPRTPARTGWKPVSRLARPCDGHRCWNMAMGENAILSHLSVFIRVHLWRCSWLFSVCLCVLCALCGSMNSMVQQPSSRATVAPGVDLA